MDHGGGWRELVCCDSRAEARTIATSIAAMEYDVRLIDMTGGLAGDGACSGGGRGGAGAARSRPGGYPEIPFRDAPKVDVPDPDCDDAGVYRIDVREADWPDLNEVLWAIVDEQGEFDARLEERDRCVCRAQRVLLGALIGIVAVLAMLRLIEL